MKRMIGRIVVGATLIAVVAAVLWVDWLLQKAGWPAPGWVSRPLVALPLAVLTVVLIAAGYLELARLTAAADMPISRTTGMICAMVIGTLPFWRQAVEVGRDYGEAATQLILGVVVMLLFADQLVRYRTKGAIRHIAGSLLAVCYLGVCGAVVLGIRMHIGIRGFILFLAVVKATDIGAYFVGTFFGRHKLVPWLSEGKTWEGLVGGLVLAAACSVAIGARFQHPVGPLGAGTMYWWDAILFAVLLGLFGQAADLCESTLKRDAGLKDSGRGVPTFGGVLDVIDSPLLAAPVGYVLLALFR